MTDVISNNLIHVEVLTNSIIRKGQALFNVFCAAWQDRMTPLVLCPVRERLIFSAVTVAKKRWETRSTIS